MPSKISGVEKKLSWSTFTTRRMKPPGEKKTRMAYTDVSYSISAPEAEAIPGKNGEYRLKDSVEAKVKFLPETS